MEKFVIDGGIPLSGNVVPAGNKNAALPCLAASALTAEEVVVRNVPRIRDVQAMLDLLEHLGATVEWKAEHDVAICAAGITAESFVDPRLSARIRAAFLLPSVRWVRASSATTTRRSCWRARCAPVRSSWTSRRSWAPRTRCSRPR
jgi:UDP-N-acetylglucosamine enolpyruvyl transferase